MQSAPIRSFEYKNAFLYVVIREEPGLGPDSYIYCCGINLSRFCRLSWKKAGICSNPAVRGIQLLRTHVFRFCGQTRHDRNTSAEASTRPPSLPTARDGIMNVLSGSNRPRPKKFANFSNSA